MEIRDLLASFHIGAASGWDLFIALVFLIAVLIYGFFLGRNRMVILLISSYFSLSIIKALPWQKLSSFGWLGVSQDPSASSKIIIFLVVILLLYFFIPRSVLSSTLRIKKRGDASWIQLFILSVVQVGFLAMVILSFLPVDSLNNLGSVIRRVFIGPEAEFVWVAIPILTVVLMRRKKNLEKK